MTGTDVITGALKTLGALAAGETPSAEEAADALARLNDLLDSLATQRLSMFTLTRTVYTMPANTPSFTIGPGGNINLPRPVSIAAAGLIFDPSATAPVEIGLPVLTDQAYQRLPNKTLSGGTVNAIYYDFNDAAGLGRITPWPIPNVSTLQLVLYTPAPLAAMTLAGSVTLPPAYARYLRYGLARELAPEWGRPWTPELRDLHDEALADVKRANVRLSDLQLPWATGMYDIFSDSVIR